MSGIEDFRATINILDGKEFIESLPKICADMHNELGILTFGMIIYDQSNPEVRKLLRDSDYWAALEKTSGDRMVIFCLQDRIEPLTSISAILMRKVLVRLKSVGILSFFQTPFDDLGESCSYIMKRLFDHETVLVYPSVIFFQVAGDEISDYCFVPLERHDVYHSYKEMNELFQCVAGVLTNITPPNFGNRKEIFNLIKDKLLTRKYALSVLRGSKHVGELVSILRNMFPKLV